MIGRPRALTAMLRPVLALVLVAAACGGKRAAPPAPVAADATAPADAPPADAPPAIDLAALASAAGVTDACLVVRDPDGSFRRSDPACGAVRLRPASTFKLLNTLIGADVGLIDSPDTVLVYDPKRYPPDQVAMAAWRADATVRQALAISAVPLYQLLAVKIGAARMQAHLDALGYGNRSIEGGIDRFWLSGGLAISADEQVDFLARLLAGTLPVTARAQAIVRDATPIEEAGDATLHWKTGTGALDAGGWVGWLVGWIDRPDGAHVFACWIRDGAADFETVRAHRTAVCRGALAALGLAAAPAPSP